MDWRRLCSPVFVLCLLSSSCLAQASEDTIGNIESFGYKGLNLEKVQKALPVHAGDTISEQTKDDLRRAIDRAIGIPPTDVVFVCCDSHGNSTLYIGLQGASTKAISCNPKPTELLRLPRQAERLYSRWEDALGAAAQKGGDALLEDSSHGYAVSKDSNLRARQLEMRSYALKHGDTLIRVLMQSAVDEQRQIAAQLLGYSQQSAEQIQALVTASHDSDDLVRNNATRALGVLANSKSKLAAQIPADGFIDMLSSGIWGDRNKASYAARCVNRYPRSQNTSRVAGKGD